MKVTTPVIDRGSILEYSKEDNLVILLRNIKPLVLHFKPTPRKGCGRVVRQAHV